MELSREQASELFEQKLREICTDEEWAVFRRRLHPEDYPPPAKPGFWTRLRAIITFSELPGDPDF